SRVPDIIGVRSNRARPRARTVDDVHRAVLSARADPLERNTDRKVGFAVGVEVAGDRRSGERRVRHRERRDGEHDGAATREIALGWSPWSKSPRDPGSDWSSPDGTALRA